MRVMQLMRQDVAFSTARGRVLSQRAEFLCVRASLDTRCSHICYADASQMNGLGFPSPSIHPFHSVSSFRRKRISSIRSTENVEMLHAL